MSTSVLPFALLAAAQLMLVAAAAQDAIQFRISNLIPALLALLFAIWAALTGIGAGVWQNIAAALAVFFVGALLFRAGWLGGGDVKLWASAALWFDLLGTAQMIGLVTFAGAVLTALLFALRRLWLGPVRHPLLRKRGPIPYGVAIACGALLAFATIGPSSGKKVGRPYSPELSAALRH